MSKVTNAGPMDLAGFIDAPETGPPKRAHIKTVKPMASPAVIPCSLDPVATLIMTNIRVKLKMNSIIKDCTKLPFGKVSPRVMASGKRDLNTKLANMAPKICAVMYHTVFLIDILLATKKPIETAGFKCAPDISPIA